MPGKEPVTFRVGTSVLRSRTKPILFPHLSAGIMSMILIGIFTTIPTDTHYHYHFVGLTAVCTQ
jgi:hypothetical protein